MREIEIEIKMNSNKDITISNKTNNKVIEMNNEKKVLNAKELYDLMEFSMGNNYQVKTVIDENANDSEKKIFESIVDTIKKISKEINEIKLDVGNE